MEEDAKAAEVAAVVEMVTAKVVVKLEVAMHCGLEQTRIET